MSTKVRAWAWRRPSRRWRGRWGRGGAAGHFRRLTAAPDANRTGRAARDDDLALEQGAAHAVHRHHFGDAVALADDEQGVGVDHGDVGDLRIADDDGRGRAVELNAGRAIDLDIKGAALGQGRSGGERRGHQGGGQYGDGKAGHRRL